MNSFTQSLTPNKPIRMALIATYPQMSAILSKLASEGNISLIDIYASFEDAVKKAIELEDTVDVILTRGGTGQLIKQAVSIPVISIPITPFDLSMSISQLPEEIIRIGFVNFSRPIFGVDEIEQLYNKKILQYQFESRDDLRRAAEQVREDGCQIYIGGAEGVQYAKKLGLRSIEIVSGKEAIYQAFMEAINLVQIRREDQKHVVRLKSAFDALTEGICVADDSGKISIFNPAAAKIFGLDEMQVLDCDIHSVLPKSTTDFFDQQEQTLNHLDYVGNITLNTNYFPIYINEHYIGMVSTFEDITKIQRLEGQIRRQISQKGFQAKYRFDDILTKNPQMNFQKELALLYANSSSSVLIEGETGTGKELFAHSIHNASPFSLGPFVSVNCSAIPEQLLESELFGYAPGAFTGANKGGKKGLFELAQNGTIFLDEIGEMPQYLQARLLRALQEKEIMRLGDNKIISISCRVISATNRTLSTLVSEGKFREDLYYRLNIFHIALPPLRSRKEDIPLLCRHFAMSAGLNLLDSTKFLDDQLQKLKDYHWPGNIRELRNICSRISVLQNLNHKKDVTRYSQYIISQISSPVPNTVTLHLNASLSLKEAISEAQDQYIAAILSQNNNNHTTTAKQLGIGRTTLWRIKGVES